MYEKYKWRETKSGVWQRDIDEAEMFYSALIKFNEGTGRMHFAITGHLSITVPVSETSSPEETARRLEQSLQNGWLRLRHQSPTIASQVKYDNELGKWQKTYETSPTDSARQAWLESTFKTVSTGQTGKEWANSDPPAPKRATLFVVAPPSSDNSLVQRDLVLRSPHDIIDGIGTLQLLNNLMKHTADAYAQAEDGPLSNLPAFDGSEVSRLSPPYRVAANIPETPTPTQQQRLDAMKADKSGKTEEDDPDVTNLSVPYKADGPKLPGKHQRVFITVPASQTARLTAALKKAAANATVTHAFHAAIAMTVRDVQPTVATTSKVRYINYILRNERSRCTPPYNTPDHAAAVYHSVSSGRLTVDMPAVCRDRNAEFVDILNQIRDYYLRVRDDAEHYALAPYIWTAGTPGIPKSVLESGKVMPVSEPNTTPSVSISSMGLVDRIVKSEHGEISLYDPWVTGEELGTGLGLFLGTFRGELCLSGAYNDAWHDREEVLGFLERCRDVVFECLDGLGQ